MFRTYALAGLFACLLGSFPGFSQTDTNLPENLQGNIFAPMYPYGPLALYNRLTNVRGYDSLGVSRFHMVLVRFTIDEHGNPQNIGVDKTSANESQECLLEAYTRVKKLKWTRSARRRDGRPFAWETSVTVPCSMQYPAPPRRNRDPNPNDSLHLNYPDNVFTEVEEMPVYPGGEKAMWEFLKKNIAFPEPAHEALVNSTLKVLFVIEPDGSVSEPQIIAGEAKFGLEEEAFRLVRLLKFKGGKHKGRPVKVWYVLTMRFNM